MGLILTRGDVREKHALSGIDFALQKLARRDSSRYDQTAMEFQPLLDQVAAKPGPFMNNESLKKAGTFGPAYMHGAIVEM